MSTASSAIHIIIAMCAAQVLSMVGVFAFPALLPVFLQEWSLNHTQAGWINGVYFAGYAVAVPILASLTDRLDARRIYIVFALVGMLAAVGFAMMAQGFWSGLLFRTLGGLGLAGTFIPGLKAIVDRVQGTSAQNRAVAFYTATFSLGTSLSFFSAGELGARFGWRWAFVFAAVASLTAMLLAAVVLQPQRKSAETRPQTHFLDFRPVLRNQAAMAYILSYAAHMWELFAMRSWMVVFLTFSLTLQADPSGYWSPASVAALTGLVAMWASIVGSELATRFSRIRVLTWIMGGSAVFACGIGFSAGLPYPLVVFLCMGYALFVQGDSAALHNGTVQNADPQLRGATMAVQSLLGFCVAFISPLVVGIVLDMTGGGRSVASWGAAYITMGVVVAIGPLVLHGCGRCKHADGVSSRPL